MPKNSEPKNHAALVLLVAQVPLNAEEAEECPGEAIQAALDSFREAELPRDNYGISLWRASGEDLEGFAQAGCLLPNPGLLITDQEEDQP